ncbi:M28 family peptidase [bacterium]|nr:M28 family peptidase [bacterium]
MHFNRSAFDIYRRISGIFLYFAACSTACALPATGQDLACKAKPVHAAPGTRDVLSPERLRKHVFTLASDPFGGRSGRTANPTIEYIEKSFLTAGLKPGFAEGYRQPVVQASSGRTIGTNLAAKVEGSDPALKEEWIILSAHWDHLGTAAPRADTGKDNGGGTKAGKATVFSGADDNASGVAMLLETAAWFARPENRPKRSMLFVAFDLEEFGLFGSRHFAANSPVPLDRIRLFMTADMIGRSLSGICREWVFVIGSERLPQSRRWIASAAADRSVRAGLLGTDLVGVRSDYGPFMTKKVPYLFFSTGESEVYHTPEDKPETIDYDKLHQIAELIRETAALAASDANPGSWKEEPEPAPEELTVIASVLEAIRSPESGLKLGGLQKTTIERTLDKIRDLAARGGAVSESERRAIVRAAQFLMFTAL